MLFVNSSSGYHNVGYEINDIGFLSSLLFVSSPLRLVKARSAIMSLQSDLDLARGQAEETLRMNQSNILERLKEKEGALARAEHRANALSTTDAVRREEIANLSGEALP